MDAKMSRYFSRRELECSRTGYCNMDPDFLARLDNLREMLGRPVRLSSAYRHHSHPAEASKPAPGWHAKGKAADILCSGEDAYEVVAKAIACGFRGIGIAQTGPHDKRFIHVDTRDTLRVIWSY